MSNKIYILLFIITASCTGITTRYYKESSSGSNKNDELKKSYNEHLILYEKKLISHFPNIDSGQCYQFSVNDSDTKDDHYINLIMSFPKSMMRNIELYAQKNSIRKYHFTDSCLMILNYLTDTYNRNSIFKLNTCTNLSQNLLPVSNFKFCDGVPVITKKFIRRANIYVLGAERGKFLSTGSLSKNGVGLPNEWGHGYSKGIAIYGDIAIYWLEVW